MILVNFSHPFTDEQTDGVRRLVGADIDRVLSVPVQFDPAPSFVEQARALVDSVGLSTVEWQTLPMVVNPPALAVIALLVVAELHGRMGYFPPVVRLRPVADALPPRFEVAEILNLQAVREAARKLR